MTFLFAVQNRRAALKSGLSLRLLALYCGHLANSRPGVVVW